MIEYVTSRYVLLIIGSTMITLLLGQLYSLGQSEVLAVNSSSSSKNGSEQDICSVIADLRSSLRTATDYLPMLPMNQYTSMINSALSDATDSVQDARGLLDCR